MVEQLRGHRRVGHHRRARGANRVDRHLAADPAGRGGHEAATEPLTGRLDVALQQHVHHVARVRLAVRSAVPRDQVEVVRVADETFGVEEAGHEVLVVAGRAHGHREGHPAQPDLERLLDRELVRYLDRVVAADLHHAMRNCGSASGNLECRLWIHRTFLPAGLTTMLWMTYVYVL